MGRSERQSTVLSLFTALYALKHHQNFHTGILITAKAAQESLKDKDEEEENVENCSLCCDFLVESWSCQKIGYFFLLLMHLKMFRF